ncbi:MAG: type 4a pilus biogenesis protein PilO [Candidatus Omnitrophica bacterium]|nr:type 4a pilus biogenesis protein PilO [Candidatus Omnitrophota bacterium]
MTLNSREIFLMGFYLVMIVGIGTYFFFFQVVAPRHNILKGKIVSTEEALLRVSNILSTRDIVENEYNSFQEKFSRKEVKQTVSTEILQDIKDKAFQAGLNVINLKPLSVNREGLYGEFDFKLETEGHLKNFGKFLYDLDDSAYIFGIKYTQINAQEKGAPLKLQLLLSAALANK